MPITEKYANLVLWSDIEPFEIISITPSGKTISARRMNAETWRDDKGREWKPVFNVGGFCGTCVNQHTQKWTFTSAPEAPIIKIRLRKDGCWYSSLGKHILSNEPQRYYDFSF